MAFYPRVPRRGESCAAPCGVKEKLLVSLRAGQAAGFYSQDGKARGLSCFADALDGFLLQFRVSNNAALADLAAFEFELGFDQEKQLGILRGGGSQCR